jgi:hypothetical protein
MDRYKNVRYRKWRFKMQEKFDKLFEKREEDKEMNYVTRKYFRQVLLSNIEGIKIINIAKEYNEHSQETERIITFEFDEKQSEAVNKIVQDCEGTRYKDVRLDNFAELKRKRKQLIEEYYKRKNDEL